MAEEVYLKCIVDTTQNVNSKFVEYGDPTSYNGSAQCQKAAWEILDPADFGASTELISSLTQEQTFLLWGATLGLFATAFVLRTIVDFILNKR